MNLSTYSKKMNLDYKNEVDKCLYIGYYLMVKKGAVEFSLEDLLSCFDLLHFSKPNVSRLKGKLKTSKAIISGKSIAVYKLHSKTIKTLDEEMPDLKERSEEIISDDDILPEILFSGTRGYLISLSKQINASYENNIFDGCAVLMRRLIEILLIHSYENLGIDSEIKDSDENYKMLNHIVTNAKANRTLALSRNTKKSVESYRSLGNFSAHKIFYNAKRKDIDIVKNEFRASVEELMYKSGIKN